MDQEKFERFTQAFEQRFGLNDGDFVDYFYTLIDQKDKKFFADTSVDIQYTEDEYGRASKELGLIKHAYEGDAGIDLPVVLLESERKLGLTIWPGDRIILHTGMRLAFPEGYWGRIIHRSSTEKLHRLRVIEGVIDQYRGELLVQVHNMNTFPIIVQHGQRLGQLILLKTASFKCREVSELPPSQRGTRGFGSSGK